MTEIEMTDKQRRAFAIIEGKIEDVIQKPSTIAQARAFLAAVAEYAEATEDALIEEEKREKRG